MQTYSDQLACFEALFLLWVISPLGYTPSLISTPKTPNKDV